MLWATDGALSAIEIAWTGATVPREVPPAHDFRPIRWH